MSEFEDNLWLAVVHEHGDELARTGRTVHKHKRAPRPQLLAGTTVGLAAMATAAALLLGASTSSPAFAVTRNPDGTVTVNLMQQSGSPARTKSSPRWACERRSGLWRSNRRSLSARAAPCRRSRSTRPASPSAKLW